MKKIVIDLSSTQPANRIQTTGGGVYAEKMFYMLHKRYGSEVIVGLWDGRKGENSALKKYIDDNKVKCRIYNSEEGLSDLLNEHSAEVLFLPICYPKYQALEIKGDPVIITTIHDLSSIYEANVRLTKERLIERRASKELVKYYFFGKKLRKKYIEDHKKISRLSKNQIIITDSDYSKEQMIKYLEIDNAEKIYVFYPLLFDGNEEQKDADLVIDGIEDNGYLLFVSANRWHKNNYFAITAVDKAISDGDEYLKSLKYVVIGLDDRRKKVYDKVLKNKENYVLKSYTTREEYDYLMSHAKALIYPSLFEGFGAPPIEAMRQGTVPLCSTSTCIPEISKDAAVYFDPYDREDFLSAVLKTNNGLLMRELEAKGKVRYQDIVERQDKDLEKALSIFEAYIN